MSFCHILRMYIQNYCYFCRILRKFDGNIEKTKELYFLIDFVGQLSTRRARKLNVLASVWDQKFRHIKGMIEFVNLSRATSASGKNVFNEYIYPLCLSMLSIH